MQDTTKPVDIGGVLVSSPPIPCNEWCWYGLLPFHVVGEMRFHLVTSVGDFLVVSYGEYYPVGDLPLPLGIGGGDHPFYRVDVYADWSVVAGRALVGGPPITTEPFPFDHRTLVQEKHDQVCLNLAAGHHPDRIEDPGEG